MKIFLLLLINDNIIQLNTVVWIALLPPHATAMREEELLRFGGDGDVKKRMETIRETKGKKNFPLKLKEKGPKKSRQLENTRFLFSGSILHALQVIYFFCCLF